MTPEELVEAALDDTWHLGRHPATLGDVRVAYCGKLLDYTEKEQKPLCQICREEFFRWVNRVGGPLAGK